MEAEFIRQGRNFTTEHRIEMAKQEAAALEIAAIWHTEIEDPTKWDINLITKKANMIRY